MSTPVTMPLAGKTGGFGPIAEYVAAVRIQLDDLALEEVEELTGGLEADLADALPEGTVPLEQFGAPGDYAAELRSAAGLAPRAIGDAGRRPSLRGLSEQVTAALHRQPWWPALSDIAVALLPVWWVLRGYTAYQAVGQGMTNADQVLPYSWPTWTALVVLVVGSFELGRRNWTAGILWRQVLIAGGNLLAVFLISIAILPTGTQAKEIGQTWSDANPAHHGLYNGEYQVVNVFPYDKNGNPLTDVQLFDDRGRPIAVGESKYTGRNDERIRLVPPLTADGAQSLNVFPLLEQVTVQGFDQQTGDRVGPPAGRLRVATLPDPTHAAVIPLPVPAAAGPTLAAGPTASATAGPSPSN